MAKLEKFSSILSHAISGFPYFLLFAILILNSVPGNDKKEPASEQVIGVQDSIGEIIQ